MSKAHIQFKELCSQLCGRDLSTLLTLSALFFLFRSPKCKEIALGQRK